MVTEIPDRAERRRGFVEAIDYIRLAASMSVSPAERDTLAAITAALVRKVNQVYPTQAGQPGRCPACGADTRLDVDDDDSTRLCLDEWHEQ